MWFSCPFLFREGDKLILFFTYRNNPMKFEIINFMQKSPKLNIFIHLLSDFGKLDLNVLIFCSFFCLIKPMKYKYKLNNFYLLNFIQTHFYFAFLSVCKTKLLSKKLSFMNIHEIRLILEIELFLRLFTTLLGHFGSFRILFGKKLQKNNSKRRR